MIQSIMLVTLGFLLASLITVIVAPAFWSRAVRLTARRLRQTLPVTETEFRAEKDQLRAKYAVRVHQLETRLEHAKLAGARQTIEINRRDARLTKLEAENAVLTSDLEENRNARHVLEQTVNDRLPKLEQRVVEARRLLVSRDREIAALNDAAQRQHAALAEAKSLNEQLAAENERVKGALATRQSSERRRFFDGGGDTEFALRSEVELLRARSREQIAYIDRLKQELAGTPSEERSPDKVVALELEALKAQLRQRESELSSLRKLVGELRASHAEPAADASEPPESPAATAKGPKLAERLRLQEQELDDRAAKIKLLEDKVALLEGSATISGEATSKDGRPSLKSRLSAVEARAKQESATIQRLRAELAAANERAARQAAMFRDEMRRFQGTGPSNLQAARMSAARKGENVRDLTASSATTPGGNATGDMPEPVGASRGAPARAKGRPSPATHAAERAAPAGDGADEGAADNRIAGEGTAGGGTDSGGADSEAASADGKSRLLDRLRSYDRA